MAKRQITGKKPKNFRYTVETLLSYLGRHKLLLLWVAVLVTVSALANLLGTYMIRPVVNSLSSGDMGTLIAGVADGTIEVIATDHAPHTAEEKSRGLAGSAMGIVGLECAFPLMYKYMVLPGTLTLEKLVALMSDNPRRIFGLGGGLNVGDEADFTVLDLGAQYEVDPAAFLSKGRATPFAGWPVQGRAVLTVVGGREAYRDDGLQL